MKTKYLRILSALLCILFALLIGTACKDTDQDVGGGVPSSSDASWDVANGKEDVSSEKPENPSCAHEGFEWITDTEATVKAEGSKRKVCSLCGQTLATVAIPKLECEHKTSEWITDAEPTAQSEGSKRSVCSDCGETLKTEVIPKLECPHTVTEWTIDIEATIHAEGSKRSVCSACGETLSTEIIPKLECPHADAEWITETEPTLDKKGLRKQVCPACQEILSTEELPKLYLEQEQIYEMLERSMIKVTTYRPDGETVIKQGSGFFIDSNGTFITNAHVVSGCYYVRITDHLGNVYDADLMFIFNQVSSDLAVLRVSDYQNSIAVNFSKTEAELTDTVFAIGFPQNADSAVITKGEIKATNIKSNHARYYASTASVKSGNSGGAFVNGKGEVIGITTGAFGNGYCAALMYTDISPFLSGNISEGKAPNEFFNWEINE